MEIKYLIELTTSVNLTADTNVLVNMNVNKDSCIYNEPKPKIKDKHKN